MISANLVISNEDTSGVKITPHSLTIHEGRRKHYAVALKSKPEGVVTVTINVPANAGFTVNPGTLTFTPQSWEWNYVFVRATQDLDAADEPALEISHSLDSIDTKYHGASSPNVSTAVRDNSAASVMVTPTELRIGEGETGTYTVALDTTPTEDVTVTVDGFTGTSVSVSTNTLTFTPSNFAAPQEITVTAGQDQDAGDETVTLTHAVSGGGYAGVTAESVVVSVTDDETSGVSVSPTELTLTEGTVATYTIVLTTEPAGDVTVTVNDPTDNSAVTADPASLTFTTLNWDTAQTVTAAVGTYSDNDTATVPHTVSRTDDAGYSGPAASNVAVTVEEPTPVAVSFLPGWRRQRRRCKGPTQRGPGTDGNHTPDQGRAGRGYHRRLLGGPSERHLQLRRHREGVHPHSHIRQRQRRRGERQAHLRHPAQRSCGRNNQGDHSQHHR